MDKVTFDYEILQCIDKGLGNCGPSIKQTTYWQLLVVFNLKASTIPTAPEVFCRGLEQIFGSVGAVLIEREIVKEIMSRFQIRHLESKRFLQAFEYIQSKELASVFVTPRKRNFPS